MKLKVLVTMFFTIAAIIGGAVMTFLGLMSSIRFPGNANYYTNDIIVGVLLLSGGLTRLWILSRSNRDN